MATDPLNKQILTVAFCTLLRALINEAVITETTCIAQLAPEREMALGAH
jgi:hypothetical protein